MSVKICNKRNVYKPKRKQDLNAHESFLAKLHYNLLIIYQEGVPRKFGG